MRAHRISFGASALAAVALVLATGAWAQQSTGSGSSEPQPAAQSSPPSAQPAPVPVTLRRHHRVPEEGDDRGQAAQRADQPVARTLPPQLQRNHSSRERFQELEEKIAPEHPEKDLEQSRLGIGQRADAVSWNIFFGSSICWRLIHHFICLG